MQIVQHKYRLSAKSAVKILCVCGKINGELVFRVKDLLPKLQKVLIRKNTCIKLFFSYYPILFLIALEIIASKHLILSRDDLSGKISSPVNII